MADLTPDRRAASASSGHSPDPQRIRLLVHGGSGTITRDTLSAADEQLYRACLARALLAGHALLAGGGTALDAVVAAVAVLEDDPLFNAGRGAVFTAAGGIELDAALMDGRTAQAGAVAGVTRVRNPIKAAQAVMAHSGHVMLCGQGADQFALAHGLEIVDPAYFFTQHRWDQLRMAQARQTVQLDHDGAVRTHDSRQAPGIDHKYGTVGAVALDPFGNLAAGTSTGGVTNKRFGRVGDSPIIGAGTFADNASVAVSCTGEGEFFMRGVAAYDVAARIRYGGASLAGAVSGMVANALTARQGRGGLIALTAHGEFEFGFNTEGMYRGVIGADGQPKTAIYAD